VPVNLDISASLTRGGIDQCDFWWLNNGITIIATAVNVAGKDISLENIQIVNGLQTTETIYEHFKKYGNVEDDRAVLVKIVVTQDPEVRDRIIKATNYQTGVELSSLRATEKIQRDIEEILLKENWYYDRRKNFHKNQGRPIQRIVSPVYLASCIVALAHKDPSRAARLRSKFMRIDEQYNAIFDPTLDIRIYPIVLNVLKTVEHSIVMQRSVWGQRQSRFAADYRSLFSFIWVSRRLGGPQFKRDQLLNLREPFVDSKEMDEAWALICKISEEGGFKPKRLYRNRGFVERVKDALAT
jgi:hypothetical protein